MSNIKPKLCGRCGRPLWFGKGPYCAECAIIIRDKQTNPRCSHCGANLLQSNLLLNKKRGTVYCLKCLKDFFDEMRERGFDEATIKKVYRSDFQLLGTQRHA